MFDKLFSKITNKKRLNGFDSEYYLNKYPDVASSNMDPLGHYLKHGYEEGRFKSLDDEKIKTNIDKPLIEEKTYLNDLLKYVNRNDFKEDCVIEKLSVTVIVPVYNGYHHLKKLIPSLLKNTPVGVSILLIDDASPDTKVSEYLDQLNSERIKIIRNKENLGFVKTINLGMQSVKTDYAIWLNSDTIVPENWIPRLLKPYFIYTNVATTTPFTNSGTIFSFPKFGIDNKIDCYLEHADKAFSKIVPFFSNKNLTYSGTGFCMTINMACWKSIGPLDSKTFEKGYGEENDWCFRASIKGWKHLLVSNLFVQHFHGGSFLSEEKKRLISEHYDILKKKYPKILNDDVVKFYNLDPWKEYRYLASLLIRSEKKKFILLDLSLDNKNTSGAIDYRKQLIDKLIKKGNNVILLQYSINSEEWTLTPCSIDNSIKIYLNDIYDLNNCVDLLEIDEVIVNNLAFNSATENVLSFLTCFKKIYKTKLSYVWHDYFPVCPSFFLLKNEGPCMLRTNYATCESCICKNKYKIIDRTNIKLWRQSWRLFFNEVDEVRFFSEFSRNIAIEIYPRLKEIGFVKWHEPLIKKYVDIYKKPASSQITIAFVGSYSDEKGAIYFEKLSKSTKSSNVRFIVIGKSYKKIVSNITYFGCYQRDDLADILNKEKVHVVVNPNLCNETFSFCAQELMMIGVPLVVFNNGAPVERLRKLNYKDCFIVNEFTVESLKKGVNSLLCKVYGDNVKI